MKDSDLKIINSTDDLRVLIRQKIKDERLKMEDICNRTYLYKSTVFRFLNGQVSTTIDSLLSILSAVGLNIYIGKTEDDDNLTDGY